jgi:hypothetical protein
LKAVVKAIPAQAGIELANWNWKVVREFVKQNFGQILREVGVERRAGTGGFDQSSLGGESNLLFRSLFGDW